MGICERDKVHDLYLRISKTDSYKWMSLPQLRGQAIRSLMDQCWDVFEQSFDSIMNGLRTDDLQSSLDSKCKDQLNEVSAIYNSIFGNRKKVATELGAYHVLGRVLKAFIKTIQAIAKSASYSEVHFLSKRTIELTWGRKHAEENLKQPYHWWLSQVMDYVSGMTDDYATRLSRQIGGFSADVE
jgi:dGTPase